MCKFRFRLVYWIDIHSIEHSYGWSVGTFCRALCRNGWTDWIAVWVVYSGGPNEAKFNHIRQVAPMCPHGRAHWRHLANTTEMSVRGRDAVFCQITLTTCFYCGNIWVVPEVMVLGCSSWNKTEVSCGCRTCRFSFATRLALLTWMHSGVNQTWCLSTSHMVYCILTICHMIYCNYTGLLYLGIKTLWKFHSWYSGNDSQSY